MPDAIQHDTLSSRTDQSVIFLHAKRAEAHNSGKPAWRFCASRAMWPACSRADTLTDMTSVRSLFAALLAALVLSTSAEAGEFVRFKSGDTTLTGYMARPAGSGPFPAVVLLHGCGGYHSSMMSWTDRLAAMGYVALSVDSFGPRGINVNC